MGSNRAVYRHGALRGPLRSVRDPRHGTPTGYSYWGCRCKRCVKAYYQSLMEAKERRRERMKPEDHGLTGYRQCGCRCDVCKEASRAAWKNGSAARRNHAQYDKRNRLDLTELA